MSSSDNKDKDHASAASQQQSQQQQPHQQQQHNQDDVDVPHPIKEDDAILLPIGWSVEYSKSQKRNYYHHAGTKHTQWHFPTQSDVAKADTKSKQQQHEQNSSSSSSNNNSNRKRPPPSSSSCSDSSSLKKAKGTVDDDVFELADSTCVAIIVPFRDIHVEQKRSEHLKQFVPYMNQFLNKLRTSKQIRDYHIYIIEQQKNDQLKFNRGKLLNIGFDIATKSKKKHDVYIFHDVDLLPQQDCDEISSWYSQYPSKPIHIARVWDRYNNNPKYFGGIVSFSRQDYVKINGYPNNFYGWGGEDDEMQRRLECLNIQFTSPTITKNSKNNPTKKKWIIDLESMSLDEKLSFLRQHKSWKCMVKWELAKEHATTWKTNGLSDLQYQILHTQTLSSSSSSSHHDDDDNHDESPHATTKYTVDLQIHLTNHWTNAKAGIDYVEQWTNNNNKGGGGSGNNRNKNHHHHHHKKRK